MTDATPTTEVPPRLLDFLRDHTTLTLATASPGGIPRATSLRYTSDGMNLYLWTRSESSTARQIEQNPLVSFTIAEESAGLQGSGEARVVLSGDELGRVIELFADKFPMALGSSTMNISFFRITPSDIKLVDETYGGGRGDTQIAASAEYQVEQVYSVLGELPASEVGVIAGRLHRVEVEPQAVVARQGAPADKFVIVLEGELEVVREADGSEEVVERLAAGDFFGEVAILRDTPRTSSLRAVGSATLLTLDRDDFRAVVAQSLGTTTADFDRILGQRPGGSGES